MKRSSHWMKYIAVGPAALVLGLSVASAEQKQGSQAQQQQSEKKQPADQSLQQNQGNQGTRAPAASATTYGIEVQDVEQLLDDVSQYIGQKITVPGEVQDKTATSFVLESGGWLDNEILVIPSRQVNMDQFAEYGEDNNVSVVGTVKRSSERNLGFEVSPLLQAELDEVNVYLLAEQIVPQPD